MNDELIKRIDEWTDEILPDDLLELLQDCRAGIERLAEELKESRALGLKLAQDRETQDAENESLRDQNTALDEKLAEYSERKYVPMTNYEIYKIWRKPLGNTKMDEETWNSNATWRDERRIEAEVIRRAGLEVKS